jgi:hypothetical protein
MEEVRDELVVVAELLVSAGRTVGPKTSAPPRPVIAALWIATVALSFLLGAASQWLLCGAG